jgi:hypothetical protein
MKTTKMNDEKIGINLNPKKRNQNKNIKAKIKNMTCARPSYKQIFSMTK